MNDINIFLNYGFKLDFPSKNFDNRRSFGYVAQLVRAQHS